MKNIPKLINLNIGSDDDIEDFKDLEEVTWSQEKIYDKDLMYINEKFIESTVLDISNLLILLPIESNYFGTIDKIKSKLSELGIAISKSK